MNEVETTIFQSNNKWFFLKNLYFDRENNLLTVEIYPNDNAQKLTSFLFKNVSDLHIHSDKEVCTNEFPKQIIGIDYDKKKYLYLINCGEVEYSFIAKSFHQIE